MFVLCMVMGTGMLMAALPEPGAYKIKNVGTGKYVVLQNSQLATVTGTESEAPELNLDYTTEANGEGVITALNGGGGDMIATLASLKEDFYYALEDGNYPDEFLDDMFTLRLAETGDSDGSVYLCVDVPEIENFNQIRNYLIQASNNNSAVTFYLNHMTPGNRHYLKVDGDDSFGFGTTNDETSKWLIVESQEEPTGGELPPPGTYFIKNVSTEKYVVLQNSMLADITADVKGAQELEVDYDLQANGEGVMTVLRGGGGDMIATLASIKEDFYYALEDGGYTTDFLDEMFTLRLVTTGDSEGSVYLCVDVPEIENFNEIRDYLIEASNHQQAIVFYLSHMTPGNRHYLTVDYDDSFGFGLDNGERSKWLLKDPQKTGVKAVNMAQDDENAPAYDLMGRRLVEPHGLYIQNGQVKLKK